MFNSLKASSSQAEQLFLPLLPNEDPNDEMMPGLVLRHLTLAVGLFLILSYSKSSFPKPQAPLCSEGTSWSENHFPCAPGAQWVIIRELRSMKFPTMKKHVNYFKKTVCRELNSSLLEPLPILGSGLCAQPASMKNGELFDPRPRMLENLGLVLMDMV